MFTATVETNGKFKFKFLYCLLYKKYIEDYIQLTELPQTLYDRATYTTNEEEEEY